MPKTLQTPRLVLEPFPDTEAEIYRAIVGSRVENASNADLAGYLRRVAAGEVANVIAMYALRRRADGDIVGYCALIVGRASVEEPEIAYEVISGAQKQGFATEAVTAVVAGHGHDRSHSAVVNRPLVEHALIPGIGQERFPSGPHHYR